MDKNVYKGIDQFDWNKLEETIALQKYKSRNDMSIKRQSNHYLTVVTLMAEDEDFYQSSKFMKRK